ncbi:oligosaccharyl transferase, archaeosortase A system-associated [Natrinema sp. 74]|uniref:oligosaccharyl transferase, archaeosortase A system-associated n=1 Tax=Natrinema sp. 74 TaxID=3384159 RepID=UPI0038D4EDE8
MSTDTERVEEGTATSFLESWRDWYHLPVLGVVMLFMVWVRTQSYSRFVTDDGAPALAGVDSWYHWRTIRWTAENYPHTMPYEVWTGFPSGSYVGQFGTLYDQLIVTAAMIVGLGDPSTQTLYAVALLSIPVMAALTAIPVFYAGRRLGGTLGGLVSVIVLALVKGQFLARSTVGQLDHHVGEILFMAIAVVAMMVSLTAGEREKPIYELIADRDWTALRTPTIYSVLAGVALTLYIWIWPAGVLLIGIFGVYFAVQLILDYVRGVSPDHIAFVGAVSMGVTAILTTLLIERIGIGVTGFTLLQPLTALLVAIGCVFMAWFAREWNNRGIERRYYPAAIIGIAIVGLLVMRVALPTLYSTFIGNLTGRLIPLNPSTGTLTIVEAQPPEDFFNRVFTEFGAAFYTMLAGLAFLVIRPLFGRKFRAEHTLMIVWSLFLISMAATQVRFMYYLLLAVAVVNAAFVAELVQLFNLDLESSLSSLKQIETYQVIVVLLVVLLLFAPLLPPLAQATAWQQAEATGPHGSAMTWDSSNEWLQENTPAPGNYGGANNADQLDYYGTYTPGDDNYDYPKGAYGVMSWWDYGHLITTQAERIPHSNPFQQNARSSSAFFTAEFEQRGELIMEAIAEGEPVVGNSTDELRQAVSDNESGEPIKYVMIDDQMAGGKFSAITRWTEPGYSHYVSNEQFRFGNQTTQLPTTNENYDNTTLSSLYLQDAEGMEHYRLVHENAKYSIVGGMAFGQQKIPQYSLPLRGSGWDNQTQALQRQLSQARNNNQVYRGLGRPIWDAHVVSSVKTFERVEGATITGSVADAAGIDAENATAVAAVELETNTGRTFTYRQQADVSENGSFELTVPYATNDELTVEDGYTNSSVEATGNYTVNVITAENGSISQYSGQTAVPEPAVINGETVDVSLEEVENPSDNESAGNESTGNETDTDGTGSGDSSSSADGTADNGTAASLERIAAKPAR